MKTSLKMTIAAALPLVSLLWMTPPAVAYDTHRSHEHRRSWSDASSYRDPSRRTRVRRHSAPCGDSRSRGCLPSRSPSQDPTSSRPDGCGGRGTAHAALRTPCRRRPQNRPAGVRCRRAPVKRHHQAGSARKTSGRRRTRRRRSFSAGRFSR